MEDRVRLFGLGHSHILALLRGAELLSPDEGIIVDGINLRDVGFTNLPHRGLNGHAAKEIKKRAAKADLIFLSILGNQHARLGLIEPPVPVDFYHPDLPQLPIHDGAVVVPYRTIAHTVRDSLERVAEHYAYLKRILDKPLVQCQPPPPNPSESHIRKHPNVFQAQLSRSRVAAASFRMKMWKAQGEVMLQMCAEAGIEFLPCPQAALDESGFLAESAWALDPVHANAGYGALVLRQLARVVRSKVQGFNSES